MKFLLRIECDCGSYATFEPKRTTNAMPDTGIVYEDYSSIDDGIAENQFFSAKQYCEDELEFTCKICGNKHILTT